MAKEQITVITCDGCTDEIKREDRVRHGIAWGPQGAEISLKSEGLPGPVGDYCEKCFIEKLEGYVAKLKKIYAKENTDDA